MLFENNSFKDYEIDLSLFGFPKNMNEFKNEKSDKLYDLKEGFLKGNMFVNEYEPYKNYKFGIITPKTKKEEIELKIFELDFAINDLNLYLDLHPDDYKMFETFKKYIKEYNKVKEEYIDLVGPLCLTDVTSNNYNWLKTFPWENKGGNI